MEVEENQTIFADITVASFQDIVGLQFTLQWDSTQLQFIDVENFGLSNVSQSDNFGQHMIGSGILTFAWDDPTPSEGNTLADGETLFTVIFKVIGTGPASSELTITDFPTAIEAVNSQAQILEVTIEPGTIEVMGTTATRETETEGLALHFEPNPFHEAVAVHFFLPHGTQTRLSMYDLSGRLLFEEESFFESGAHTRYFGKERFPAPGMYLLTLSNGHTTITKRLVMQ